MNNVNVNNYYDEKELMIYARRQAILRKENKLEMLEAAIESQIELDIEYILSLYDNYEVVNTDAGFNLYVMINKDMYSYYVAFICADEEYTKFVVDHIGYSNI